MDETDRQIIELLRQNGRRSNVEVARLLDLSEGTVRKRLERLLAADALRIVGLPDPRAAGYRLRAFLSLNVEAAHLTDVGEALAALPEVRAACHVSGESHLLAEVLCASEDDLLAFISERVAAIPGVVAVRVSHVLRALKEVHQWPLPAPPPPLVLVVDDDPDFCEVTRTVLEREGYRTACASSGQEALQALRTQRPDLIVLDVMMDGVLDGWAASRKIRADADSGDVPILVVSSITTSDYLSMVPTDDDNLIDNFLSKPVAPDRLVAEVGRLARRR